MRERGGEAGVQVEIDEHVEIEKSTPCKIMPPLVKMWFHVQPNHERGHLDRDLFNAVGVPVKIEGARRVVVGL